MYGHLFISVLKLFSKNIELLTLPLFRFSYQSDREGKVNEAPPDRGVKGKEKTVLVTTPDY